MSEASDMPAQHHIISLGRIRALQMLGSSAARDFTKWLRAQVAQPDALPPDPQRAEEVPAYQAAVRNILATAAGEVPEYDKLDPVVHQVIEREGYRIEAVSFATFAGLRMTANAYVPQSSGRVPGVLIVHGHWPHGRRDPQVQFRCLALVKSGYFVLAVDCIGAGERAVTLPGAYHGGVDGAALWLHGYSLFGIQIHENVRACDYLVSRPEVDSARLAITGASGGGNQSFYTGAWDTRFSAVIPVCSTGAYRHMVGNSNCVCETPRALPAAMEQGALFSLIAPRALLVMNALNDSISFWHEDARQQIATASRAWELLGCREKVAFRALPTTHGYWPPYREALLGWLARWLKDESEATPRPEPAVEIEDFQRLSCYPEAEAPQVMTVRDLYGRLSQSETPKEQPTLPALQELLQVPSSALSLRVERVTRAGSPMGLGIALHTDDGLVLPTIALWQGYERPHADVLIWIGNDKGEAAKCPMVRTALEKGQLVWAVDLPGLGEATLNSDLSGGDQRIRHNATRACHMLGFDLAGLWLHLLRRVVTTARENGAGSVALAAQGGPGTVVLLGAGLLDGVDRLLVRAPLASYCIGDTFEHQPMEIFISNLARLGDIPQLAGLRAPGRLTVAAPLGPRNEQLSLSQREEIFASTRSCYAQTGHPGNFRLIGLAEVQSGLGRWL
jgi:dienelactone hydrolase